MDIREVKARYRGRLAVIGNVEVDLLARGTEEQVRAEVRRLLREVALVAATAWVPATPSLTTFGRELPRHDRRDPKGRVSGVVDRLWGAAPASTARLTIPHKEVKMADDPGGPHRLSVHAGRTATPIGR